MTKPECLQPVISASDLEARLQDEDTCIIDCRFDLMNPTAGREAYIGGHIPGAAYADLDDDLAAPVTPESGRHPLPGIDAAEAMFRRLGVSTGSSVVAYDSSGGAIAARAWWMLRWLGHQDVSLLDGGFEAWRSENLALESGEHAVGPGDFAAKPQPEMILTTADLVSSPELIALTRVVDARDAARFRGEVEPIDPVAGHIPGTVNLPYSECLNEDATWKKPEELRASLDALLGGDPDAPWAVMCGSGVTACHLAISGHLAGYRQPRLYVGSWSEWIRDPQRAVASGPPEIRKIPT